VSDVFLTAARRTSLSLFLRNVELPRADFLFIVVIDYFSPCPTRQRLLFQQIGLLLKPMERVSETYEPG
jgi:hypothetical protein